MPPKKAKNAQKTVKPVDFGKMSPEELEGYLEAARAESDRRREQDTDQPTRGIETKPSSLR